METPVRVENNLLVTYVDSDRKVAQAALMIESLRTFAGSLSTIPILVFHGGDGTLDIGELIGEGVTLHHLDIPEELKHFPLAGKVFACAAGEKRALEGTNSLVWMAPDCLVVSPPVLFHLGGEFDAALRPVHITNVGSPAGEPPDHFWTTVFEAVGTRDVTVTLESFIDCRVLRAYYNTHAFSISPSLGLMCEWLDIFTGLALSKKLHRKSSDDHAHRIFLHQAVFSALLATRLNPARVRMLPEEYSYPYNLHHMVPRDRKAASLNELVCAACEDRPLDPELMDDIVVEEPLLSWLS